MRRPTRLLLTFLIVGTAALLQWLLWPLVNPAPFICFYPALILSSLYGYGLLAVFLSALVAQWLFIPPVSSPSFVWPDDVVRQLVFLLGGVMIWNLTRALSMSLEKSRLQNRNLDAALERLQESEARLRNLIESTLDAVVGMDDHGLISQWNSQAEKVFGFSRQEAIGRSMSETIIPHRYREAHERGMRHYFATGEGPVLNRRIEIDALRRDGTEFPIELTITPIKSAGAIHFSAFIRDISERK